MFKSNQARLKSYVSERRIEEANADDHQAKLYNQLAIERGELDQATNLARLAKRVINRFGEEVQQPSESLRTKDKYAATDYVAAAIKNGTLDQLFKKMMNLDPKAAAKLGKGPRIILQDLRDPATGVKDATNEAMLEILKSNKDEATKQAELLQAIIDNMAGGNKIYLEEIAKAAMRREEREKRFKTMKEDFMEDMAKSAAKHEFKSPELKAAKAEFESGDFELPERTNNIDPKIDVYLEALSDKKYKEIVDDLYDNFVGEKTNKKTRGKTIELKKKAVELHKTNVDAYRELVYYLQNAYEYNILGMNPDEEKKAPIPPKPQTKPAKKYIRDAKFNYAKGKYSESYQQTKNDN